MAGRRRQRSVKGGRLRLSPHVLKIIAKRVNEIARKHGVSKSFVVAVALADHFGVSEQEQFHTAGVKREVRVSAAHARMARLLKFGGGAR
jgi:predicted transcriptional regulator